MQPNEESHSIPKLKVVPPNQIKPPTEPTPPIPTTPASPSPTNTITPSNDGRKSYHTWIMVGTILVAVVGMGFIPWDQTVFGVATVEPNPDQDQTISLPQGHILEKLNNPNNNQVQDGVPVAVTIDPQYEERLRKAKQEINEAEGNRKIAQGDLDVAITHLQRMEASRQISLTVLQQSRANVERGTSVFINEQEVASKRQQQEGARRELNAQEMELANFQFPIQQGAVSPSEQRVLNIKSEIRRLSTQIQTLDADVAQAQAKAILEGSQLRDRVDKDLSSFAEQNAGVDTANQELQQAKQKISKLDRQIQQLKKDEQILQEEKNKQTIYPAYFTGVADFREAQRYIGQKLPKAIDIKVHNPNNMLLKVKVSQLDYQYIKEKQVVSFLPEGKEEVIGQLEPLKMQQEKEPDIHDPSKRLVTVWAAVNDPQAALEKDIAGNATITIKKQRIYNIVGGEVYKLVPPFRPIFHWLWPKG